MCSLGFLICMIPSSCALNLVNASVTCINQCRSTTLCKQSNKVVCFFLLFFQNWKNKEGICTSWVLLNHNFWLFYCLGMCSFRQAIWSKMCSNWADNSYKEHSAMLYGFPSQISWKIRVLVSGTSCALLFFIIYVNFHSK